MQHQHAGVMEVRYDWEGRAPLHCALPLTCAAAFMVGRSLSLPMMMPTCTTATTPATALDHSSNRP